MTGMLVFGITYVVVSLVSGEDVYKALRVAVIGFALAGLVYIFSGRVARHR
jgi:VIT1/CCC1 family predicted Fe2+/Mn2+ transporter